MSTHRRSTAITSPAIRNRETADAEQAKAADRLLLVARDQPSDAAQQRRRPQYWQPIDRRPKPCRQLSPTLVSRRKCGQKHACHDADNKRRHEQRQRRPISVKLDQARTQQRAKQQQVIADRVVLSRFDFDDRQQAEHRGRDGFHDRISGGDRIVALPAAAAKHDPAENRHVVVPGDAFSALRAMRRADRPD